MAGHITVHQADRPIPIFPNQCSVCLSSGPSEERSFYVDTGILTEYDGSIIFCEDCLKNLIRKSFGFDPFERIERQNIIWGNKLKEYVEENDAFHALLVALEKVHIQPTTIFEMAAVEDKVSGLRSGNSGIKDEGVRISFGTEARSDESDDSNSDGVVIHSEFGLNDSADVGSDEIASVVDINTGEPISENSGTGLKLNLTD